MNRRRPALLLAAALIAAVTPAALAATAAKPKYDVTIRMTEYGIPHIQAKDFPSLGYGYSVANQPRLTVHDGHLEGHVLVAVLPDVQGPVQLERGLRPLDGVGLERRAGEHVL